MIDEAAIKKSVREIIKAIGDDPQRDGLLETPRRVAENFLQAWIRTQGKSSR
jgi:GTP cyclohydrolase I